MNSFSDVCATVKERETARLQPAGNLLQRWQLFVRRLQTRRALADLNDAQLSDVGLTREQARAESRLPFWKL